MSYYNYLIGYMRDGATINSSRRQPLRLAVSRAASAERLAVVLALCFFLAGCHGSARQKDIGGRSEEAVVARVALGLPLDGRALLQSGENGGSELTRGSAQSFIERTSPQSDRMRAILVGSSGTPSIWLGSVQTPQGQRYRVMQGASAPVLLDDNQLRQAGFQSVWYRSDKKETDTVHVSVGRGALSVKGLFADFGLEPQPTKHTTSVEFTNCGTAPLLLGTPKKPCSCILAHLPGQPLLEPGAVAKIEVSIEPRSSVSVLEKILFPVTEQSSESVEYVPMWLLANHSSIVEATALELDFGPTVGTNSVERTIQLRGNASAPFQITGVDSGKLPITHAVEETTQRDRVWRTVRFVLDPTSLPAGDYAGEVSLQISGSPPRVLRVPTRFSVLGSIQATPTVLAFGVVRGGSTATSSVLLSSPRHAPVSVMNTTAPSGCKVACRASGQDQVVDVTVQFAEPGIWRGTVVLHVAAGTQEVDVELPCTAFCQTGG